MKFRNIPVRRIITFGIVLASIAYAAFYFNYFETPTGDYIGNIRGPVSEYMNGYFPGKNYKFLPLYPLLLSILTRLNPVETADPVYLTAMVLNIALYAPYIILVLFIYRRFLSEKAAWAALLFLSVNVYSIYMAINSELEMFLTFLILLSLSLTLRDSKLSFAAAFLTALIKWDSVFIVPAVMFRDFFYRKKRVIAVILGFLATSGVATWLLLSFINTRGHPYVSEIAHRGPNIYRFILDCFLVASGFVQWMAAHAWFSEKLYIKIILLGFIILPAIITVAGVVWGIILAWNRKRKEFAPIFIFFAGFLLIHMIYQNTKDRYVMPILWILTLFLFFGVTEGIAPRLKDAFTTLSPRSQSLLRALLMAITGIIYIISLGAIARDNTAVHILFALVFTALMAAVITYKNSEHGVISASLLALFCGVLINLSVYFGVQALDHHGLSRVEFKKVALWYKDHAAPGDKMLISETNVPQYYSGFGEDKYIISFLIRGNTISELIPELAAKKATYVFVDDFYIRRLAIRDPNAIDRKAWIFREIRDKGEKTGHFKLIRTFHTKGGITSYLYKFIP
ncbi:MAG: hypothetical protein A2176_10010 [Spirochaetes bacterium RBG_13_51_14]|nr:MAG: hypothetical protein A2176_10010 [Spirochaetes bacterium RBG_13_51_14]